MGTLLENRTAVVTGSGRGIGRAIALALSAEGAKVVVNDLGGDIVGEGADKAPADSVVGEIREQGGTAVANYDSVADFAAAKSIVETCVENFGQLDILVNAAGVCRTAMIYHIPEEDWDVVVAVHLKGTFSCCRHATAVMRKQGWGRIINITSDTWRGLAGAGSYGAAKAGIAGLTRIIAKDMQRYGVTCNAIAPVAETRMFSQFWSPEALEFARRSGQTEKWLLDEAANPPPPEHVAPLVVYLATEEAGHITGHVFGASRGRVALYSEPMEIAGLYKEGLWTAQELAELVPRTLGQYITP